MNNKTTSGRMPEVVSFRGMMLPYSQEITPAGRVERTVVWESVWS